MLIVITILLCMMILKGNFAISTIIAFSIGFAIGAGIGAVSSIISQGFTNGFKNINYGQVC